METLQQYKLCATSAVVLAIGSISYIIYKQHCRLRDAADLLDYLTIEIVVSEEACAKVVGELRRRCQKHRALGFDCEWVTDNGKRRPVALVQLSSFDGYSGLFRLSSMKSLPSSLKELLQDETIYKVGVAPADDGKYLYHDYSVELRSTLDIRHLAKVSGHEAGGLARLSSNLLGVVMDKSWRVRCSDWEASTLTDRQVKYAAIDAHVAVKIFVKLIEELEQKNKTALSWFYGINTNNVWSKSDKYFKHFVGVNFKNSSTSRVKPDGTKEKKRLEKKVNREAVALSRRYSIATRTKPLYNNCYLEAPDGEILCTCDKKKAMWYIYKQIGDMVKEEPFTVRLRFEPAGRAVGEVGRYYKLKKENKCVVCGSTNSYIRKNVVPREYRRYFPEIMKDHSSHDVVLLCTACHQRSNVLDLRVRQRLALMCDAPLTANRAKCNEDTLYKNIRSTARALLYQSQKHVLPEARRKQLEDILLQHYPQYDEITEELLKEAVHAEVTYESSDIESHGLKVVEYFLERGGLLGLEEMWRKHFLSSMSPQFMPELWSIKHTEEKLKVKLDEGRLSKDDLKSIGLTRL